MEILVSFAYLFQLAVVNSVAYLFIIHWKINQSNASNRKELKFKSIKNEKGSLLKMKPFPWKYILRSFTNLSPTFVAKLVHTRLNNLLKIHYWITIMRKIILVSKQIFLFVLNKRAILFHSIWLVDLVLQKRSALTPRVIMILIGTSLKRTHLETSFPKKL